MTYAFNATIEAVPISLFDHGLADQIFEDVKSAGSKIVIKNDEAACVLMSPDEYIRIMDEIDDAELLSLAIHRTLDYDATSLTSEEDINNALDITETSLDNIGNVVFE